MKKIYTRILTAIVCIILTSYSLEAQVSNWTPAGPIAFPVDLISQINGMGRVSQLKFDPVSRARVYAVAPHAVFISNDSTNTWSVLQGTDVLPTSMNFASLCIDYTNTSILYLGTGDANYYSTGAANASGVWKSTDGGNTFVRANTGMGNVLVIDILMSSADNNTLVAATSNGIWKTTNGGTTWSQTLNGGKFTSLQSNARTGSATLYAATNTDGSFYRSTDFGSTWTANNIAGTLKNYGGRVAVTTADTSVVYVSYIGNNDSTGGIIYRSADGGQTFTLKKGNTAPNITGYSTTTSGQGNYNNALGVDPNNANTVYLVSHMIYKSTDGGTTWAQTYTTNWAGTIHTDMHGIQFNPWNSSQLFDINDGGVWINTDGIAKVWTPKCQGLVSSEFYHMANSHINGAVIGGGLQDNAEVFSKNGTWYCNRGGDFGATYYADNTTNKMYYLSSGQRRDVFTGPTSGAQSLGLPSAFTASTSDVMAFSNINNNVAFWSPNPLTSAQNANYQTLDGFYVTTNLTNNPPTWTWTQYNGSKAFSMAAAYGTDSLFILYSNGSFTRVANASGIGGTRSIVNTATSFVGTTLGVASFSAGAVTTLKNGKIYLAANGNVFKSKDNGSTWIAVGAGATTAILQSQKIKRLIADTTHTGIEAMYAYTTQAVYYKDTTMTDWSFFTTNLPATASLTDMDIFYDPAYAGNSLLRASFYGRGTWQTYLANNTPQTPPTISFVSPANNTGYTTGSNITLNVNASSPGSIAKVDFYNGSTLLGTSFSVPFSYTLNNAVAGWYLITAKATDNVGLSATTTVDTLIVGACSTPAMIPQSQMRVIYTDSQNGGAASNLLDGNSATIWQVQWTPLQAPLPHEVQFALGGVYNVNKFTVLPRQDNSNGNIGNYEIYVSMDSSNWGTPVTTGTFANDASLKTVLFAEKTGKYLRFRITSALNSTYLISAAEMNVSGCLQGSNQPPAVSMIAPANNTGFVTGSNIIISANASSLNAGGSITKVDFYQGAALIGTATTSPYSFIWNNVANGTYNITAKATDNGGFISTTGAITITVSAPPTVALTAPANNAIYLTGANITLNATASSSNPGGNISKVDFYEDGQLLGTSIVPPYKFTWTNIAASNYVLTAKATDNTGLTAVSSAVNVIVEAVPVTLISTPADNSYFAQGSNVTINATASSPNTGGAIAKVDFYQGSTLLGTSTTAPYSFTWNNVANGAYIITTVATDNNGVTTTSAASNIAVGQCTSPTGIPQSQMRVIYFDSQNSATEAANNVLDGNPSTSWYTQYTPTAVSLPHEIQLSLGGVYNVNTFKYLPRQSGNSGMVGQYEVYVSMDSANWGTPVAVGSFAGTASEKVVLFTEKIGKYLRFRILSVVFGNATYGDQYSTTAELNVAGCKQTNPLVSVTAPVSGVNIGAGSSVTITANASSTNTDGSIASVQFYNGSTLLGTATSAPYTYTFSSTVLGNDTLTAVAADNYGLITTSSPVIITIADKTPPVIQTGAGTLDVSVQCSDAERLAAGLNQQPVATDDYTASPVVHLIADTIVAHCGTTYTRIRSWNFTDDAGNVSATFIQTITVLDTIAPVITGKTAVTKSANAGTCTYTAVNNEFDVAATANCNTAILGYTLSGATTGSGSTTLQGVTFNRGATNVTWTATDACGNQSTSSFSVTVSDTENPTIAAPSAISVNTDAGLCGATVILTTPATTDNCGIQSVTSDAPAFFPVGTTTVTWTVIDNSGNTATVTQTVTVSDNEVPSIMAPPSINVNTDPGTNSATVNIGSATAGDNCGIAGVTNNAPALFPIGQTIVTWTVTDIHGNTATATQSVTVTDNEKPTIMAPAAISVNSDAGKCGATIPLGNPVTGDNSGVASVSNDAPALFPVGTTTVTWIVTDINGNASTASQMVTVTDNEQPVVTTKPISITLVNGTATISAASINNGSTDNCGIALITVSKSTFFCSNIGNNTVTLTVTDIHGNTASAEAIVTVAGELPAASIAVLPANTTYTGGVPANIYLGYGPQSVTLNATATGGAPYTYAWYGNGVLSSTSNSAPVFAPTQAGYFSFTVSVTNVNGCTTTATASICVRDIRVPGSNGKVYITHVPPGSPNNAKTISIDVASVSSHLGNHTGDHLGAIDMQPCSGNIANTATVQQSQSVTEETVGGLKIKVSPNPSATRFKLEVLSDNKEKIQTIITDAEGHILKQIVTVPGELIQFGQDFKAGVYIAEVQQGIRRKTVKVIKL
ncbi:MAG: Ig-like domain-containing protein [Bacteroidota bacterium]